VGDPSDLSPSPSAREGRNRFGLETGLSWKLFLSGPFGTTFSSGLANHTKGHGRENLEKIAVGKILVERIDDPNAINTATRIISEFYSLLFPTKSIYTFKMSVTNSHKKVR
jgi:hypothetical protein